MKFIPHAAVASLIATQSMAGGLADTIVEAPMVVEEEMMAPAEGSGGWIVPLLIFGALAVAATASSSDDEGDDVPLVPEVPEDPEEPEGPQIPQIPQEPD